MSTISFQEVYNILLLGRGKTTAGINASVGGVDRYITLADRNNIIRTTSDGNGISLKDVITFPIVLYKNGTSDDYNNKDKLLTKVFVATVSYKSDAIVSIQYGTITNTVYKDFLYEYYHDDEVVYQGKVVDYKNMSKTETYLKVAGVIATKINRQLRTGYDLTLADALNKKSDTKVMNFSRHDAVISDRLRLVKLCTKALSKNENLYVQYKLDGVRATYRDGKLYSRGNLEYKLGRITNILKSKLPEGCILDGELYYHDPDGDVGDIVSAVKNGDPNNKIQYHVFDMPTVLGRGDLEYRQRLEALAYWMLTELSDEERCTVRLVISDTVKVSEGVGNTFDTIMNMHDVAVNNNHYEGLMVKLPSSKYLWGKRSTDCLKVKKKLSEEFEVAGYTHTEDSNLGKKLLIYVCMTKDDVSFQVVPKLSKEKRAEAYEYVFEHGIPDGAMYTVEFSKYTKYGVPFHPVGISMRDYE